jgi:hypothetical protein
LTRGDLEPYLRHPAQRAAVLIGLAMVVAGLLSSVLILRKAR